MDQPIFNLEDVRNIVGATTSTGAAEHIVQSILRAIYDGRLEQGDVVSENELANLIGISRTPVREAVVRLRDMGLIVGSPGRRSRIAEISVEMLLQVILVWQALFDAVLDEVGATLESSSLALMASASANFYQHALAKDAQGAAFYNYEFFSVPTQLTRNPYLLRTIESVVHVVRLGAVTLPEWIDSIELHSAQQDLIGALRKRQIDEAKLAVRRAILVAFDFRDRA